MARTAAAIYRFRATIRSGSGSLDEAVKAVATLELLREMLGTASPNAGKGSEYTVRRMLGCRWYSDEDHVREYTAGLLTGQLERAGWTVLSVEHRRGMLVAVATRPGAAP